MTEKDVSIPFDGEKSNHGGPILENIPCDASASQDFEQESFATRNGLNLRSFQKKHYGVGIVELDRKMKPRHLAMVSIGGSIGAGFFVGSGSALAKGVSDPSSQYMNFN